MDNVLNRFKSLFLNFLKYVLSKTILIYKTLDFKNSQGQI